MFRQGLILVKQYRQNNMNIQYIKAGAIIFVGGVNGAALLVRGEMDDAPGLCLIGLTVGVGALYWGVRIMSKVNKYIQPTIVLPLLFGTVGVVCIAGYFIGGVYNEPPAMIFWVLISSIAFLTFGGMQLRQVIKKRNTIKE